MTDARIGMIVPSLNTVAEDDFRAFCPAGVGYHVHRIRLRKENGRVTLESLAQAHSEAVGEGSYLADLGSDAIAFNCTGASVARGSDGDVQLARRMTEALGIPSTNTMVAIKDALAALGAEELLHVCPFADEFARIERDSLAAGGFTVRRTVSLGFTDAREAARMAPAQIADAVAPHLDGSFGGVLLSCANVRAFEAADALERSTGLPVVTSNQAMLFSVLKAAGWTGTIRGAGRLFRG